MAASPPRRKPRLEAEEEDEAPPPRDMLSSLPLEVLDNILSRLHIYAVVRTAVLSRAWRRRWESLPTVDLTRSGGIVADEVDALLLRRSAPIRNFRLVAYDSWYIDALHDWILYLSRNGVENLFLRSRLFDVRIHSSLFSCRQLVSLNLTSCRLPPAPQGFAGFPSLKILMLEDCAMSEHGGRELASLIGTSPLIEVLKLVRVQLIGDNPEDEWVIRAPNLRELAMGGYFPYGGRMEHLPSLLSAVLNGRNFAKFFMGMAQVTHLQFSTNVNWSTEVDVLDRLPFLFKNLRFLNVSVDFTKMAHILSFFCLLRSAPVLEELHVLGLSDCNGTQEFNAGDDFLNAQWADSMFAKLRVVKMKDIVCLCNEMHLMGFILSKARVLRVLSIRFAPDVLCIDKAATAIKGYPRASPDAQVIFLGRESANIGSINTLTENAEVEETQTTRGGRDSIDTSTGNAEVEEPRTASSGRYALTENAGVDETRATCSGYDSIYMIPENAELEGTQATGSRHDSMDTSTDNAEIAEAQTAGSGRGSINTFTGNAVVDETQTTSSGHDSMDTSSENAEVEEAHAASSGLGCVTTFTENAQVDETQTSSGFLYCDVRPMRRKRLDLESVERLEQLKVDKLELQSQIEMVLNRKKQELEERMQLQDNFITERNNMRSSLKRLSELAGVMLPPFPELSSTMSSLLAKSGIGDIPVNPGVSDASDDHAGFRMSKDDKSRPIRFLPLEHVCSAQSKSV
ncbi:hypothetical protein EJB05_48784, partial [Eragrostis curvula]